MKHFIPFILLLAVVSLWSCTTSTQENPSDDTDTPNVEVSQEKESDTDQAATKEKREPLKVEALEGKSLDELRIMRNEIFAKHGYKFKNQDLAKTFADKGYEAKYDNVDDKLTEADKLDINLILATERAIAPKTDGTRMLTLNDYKIGEGVTEEFKTFVQKFLKACYTEDKATLANMMSKEHLDGSWDIYYSGTFQDPGKMATVEYSLNACNSGDCAYILEDTKLPKDTPLFSIGEQWTDNDPEAVRDGSAMVFYFAKIENEFKMVSVMAAG